MLESRHFLSAVVFYETISLRVQTVQLMVSTRRGIQLP